MQVEHHELHQEFPDLCDAIDGLVRAHSHFTNIFARYNRLTGKVENLEEHDMPVADFTLEDMKKQRVKLKDEIYYYLLAYKAGMSHSNGK